MLNRSIYNILKIVEKDKHVAIITIDLIIMLSSLLANKLVMFHLILDRFADIYLHMRYQLIFTRDRVVKIVSALWTFAFVYGTVTALLAVWGNNSEDPMKVKSNYIQSYNYVVLIADATIATVAVITYLYSYCKVSSIVITKERKR